MAKEEVLEFPGVVSELLPNATFRVKLENDHEIIDENALRYLQLEPGGRKTGFQ